MKTKTRITKPESFHIPIGRRRFFKSMALASAGFTLPGYLAEAITISPTVTQGPYYPLANNIPLDKDNDLVKLNDSLTAASGAITYLGGRVLDRSGNPIRGALIELWHADNRGEYLYAANATRNPNMDSNFAGFGQYLTGSDGAYRFRTVKAGLYNGRTRHFHFGVTIPGQMTRTTTQTFWNETAIDLTGRVWATQNANDNVYSTINDAGQRASVLLDYKPMSGTTTGEVQATWDYVSGLTPVEPTYPNAGKLAVAGAAVAGPTDGNPRYRLTIPAYANYSYEVYGNPTLGELSWAALPFSLTQTGSIDRNIYTSTSEGTLNVYVEAKAVRGFYYISFRVPGANTGTPGTMGGGGGPGGPGGGPGMP
jgi:protocatechuate 3,4-dioxygenase beta subunit